jgi:hypothetical protein
MKDFISCIEVFDILHYIFNVFFESPSLKIAFRAKWNKLPETILAKHSQAVLLSIIYAHLFYVP